MIAHRHNPITVWMALIALLLVGGLTIAFSPPAAASGGGAAAVSAPPPACSVCNLSIVSVTNTCQTNGGLTWTASIANNRAGCTVTDIYTASLQIHQRQMPPGQFQTVATQTGAGTFPPGTTVLSGLFHFHGRSDRALIGANAIDPDVL